jgi:hypothetical protein
VTSSSLRAVQVSLSVRLAVGMTAAQVASGADVALAQWLAEPATAQAVARMYAPDAVIRWLHTPEIWFQKVSTTTPVGQHSGQTSPNRVVCGCLQGSQQLKQRRGREQVRRCCARRAACCNLHTSVLLLQSCGACSSCSVTTSSVHQGPEGTL